MIKTYYVLEKLMVDDWNNDSDYTLVKNNTTIRTIITSIIVIILALSVGGYVIYNKFISKAFTSLCGNEILYRIEQPKKDFELVEYRRDCGATTGYSYHLTIIKYGKELSNESGNILVSSSEVRAIWKNDNTIEVSGARQEGFKKRKEYKGIQILYN